MPIHEPHQNCTTISQRDWHLTLEEAFRPPFIQKWISGREFSSSSSPERARQLLPKPETYDGTTSSFSKSNSITFCSL